MVRELEKPETPLPIPGDNSWEAFAQLSKRFQEHTTIELEKENRLQASEKVWASVGYALTAVAMQRGWEHDSYGKKYQIAQQIGIEIADASSSLDPSPRTRKAMLKHREKAVSNTTNGFDTARVLHDNFRANEIDLPDIRRRRSDAAKFLAKLDEVLEKDGEFTPINRDDQWRLARLNGLADEAHRANHTGGQKALDAFMKRHFPLYKKIEWRKDDRPGDDDGGASYSVGRPPAGSPPPEGGRANPIPQSMQGVTAKVNLKPGKQVGQDASADTPTPKSRRPRQTKSKEGKSSKVTIRFG